MILHATAVERLMEAARERGLGPFQTVPLKDALGRVASGRIVGTEDLPAFDNSAMDGYAVASALTRQARPDAPARLTVSGRLIINGGTRIEPRHILALAALGIARVGVRVRPRVALINTGRELVDAGQKPGPGQIRNATGPFLAAALSTMGAEVKAQHCVGDDPGEFKQRIEPLGDEVDVILATGAVSMGRHDFVPRAIEELGAEILFHKTATRPGKPGLAASFGNGPLFFGMPGNPVSTAVALRFFVSPVLRFFLGQAPESPLRARLSAAIEKPEGLRCFYKGKLKQGSSG